MSSPAANPAVNPPDIPAANRPSVTLNLTQTIETAHFHTHLPPAQRPPLTLSQAVSPHPKTCIDIATTILFVLFFVTLISISFGSLGALWYAGRDLLSGELKHSPFYYPAKVWGFMVREVVTGFCDGAGFVWGRRNWTLGWRSEKVGDSWEGALLWM